MKVHGHDLRGRGAGPAGALVLVTLAMSTAIGCDRAGGTPVSVSDSFICEQTAAGTETMSGDLHQYRGVTMRCQHDSASDPRIRGVQESEVSIDLRPDRSADMWGTYRLTNVDGSWEGNWTGTVAAGYSTHAMDGVASGTGSYAGLQLSYHVTGDGRYFTLTGTISPTP